MIIVRSVDLGSTTIYTLCVARSLWITVAFCNNMRSRPLQNASYFIFGKGTGRES